jgi:lipoprotein-releasing system permease protein
MHLAGQASSVSRRTIVEIALGAALIVAGAVTIVAMTDDSGYVIGGAPIFAGLIVVLHGMSGLAGYKSFVAWRYLLNHRQRVTPRIRLMIVVGVAAYLACFGASLLLDGLSFKGGFDPRNPLHDALALTSVYLLAVVVGGVLRFSKPAMVVFFIGVAVTGLGWLSEWLVASGQLPFFAPEGDARVMALRVLGFVKIGGGALAGLALFFGCLRAFFTFFTTVPIGGVWIGTAALVCVLSVMSGFETDLREKILGSNAHIQITREDGEFLDWREVKAKIDRIPGVVASTPYAVSEVVIAANNNGMNVIIKGIDPATVGAVTDLISDLQDMNGQPDPEAMQRLHPLVKSAHDRSVPQQPRPANAMDPPPDDMPIGGDPIDFSREGEGARGAGSAERDGSAGSAEEGGAGSAAAGSAAPGHGSGRPLESHPRRSARPRRADHGEPRPRGAEPAEDEGALAAEPFGGDAAAVVAAGEPPAVDPPPSDLLTTTEQPIDYSQSGAIVDAPVPVLDLPLEPTLSRRTQALPGVLIGKELVKQTHLYPGEEVRVVSPLSDSANPDATGTPIPFNRDYRVAGMFYTGMYEYDLKYVYVTLDSLQNFLDRGDAIDGIEVRVTDADDTARYVPTDASPGLIREALGPGYRIVDWRELNRSLFSALKLEKIAMFLVLGIVILVASFSIVGNLIMVVIEKAREIALLKTLGASDVGILQLFAIQGLLIGVIGTLLGVLMGLLGCWLGKRFGIPLNPDVYYIDRLPIHVDWQSVAAAGAAGVLISIAATLYPALLAARVRPAAGMRH